MTDTDLIFLTGPDGHLYMPSFDKDEAGKPRFVIPVPGQDAINADAALTYMVQHEARGGYEMAERRVIAAELARWRGGATLIDAGAHYGLMTCAALTAVPEATAICLEPHPENMRWLHRALEANGLKPRCWQNRVAVGAKRGRAELQIDTTMGHTTAPCAVSRHGQAITVEVIPLDDLVAHPFVNAGRPLVLKLDVEGVEPEAIAGAAGLVATGQVKLILWEIGSFFARVEERSAKIQETMTWLAERGFVHAVLGHDGDEDVAVLPVLRRLQESAEGDGNPGVNVVSRLQG